MSKGGDSTTSSSSSSLPEFFQPYMTDMLAKAKTVTEQPYMTYQNPRLANFSGDTNNAFDLIRQNAGGDSALTAGINEATQGANFTSGAPFNGGTTWAGGVTPGVLGSPGEVTTGKFDFKGIPDANLDPYMNPYKEQVLDVQKRRANQAFGEQQASRDAGAVAAGAFGGDRRFVQDSLARRDLNEQLQGIEATGLQEMFDRGTSLFQTDEARRLGAYEGDAARKLDADTGNINRMFEGGKYNISNRLAADTGNAERTFASDTGNAERNLRAQMASEDARRSAAGLGLDAASLLGNLGNTQNDMNLRNAEALSGVGAKVQQREQAGLDMAYKDFMDQRDWPTKQISLYSQLLSGTPVSPNTTTTVTEPAPDFLSQLLGIGTGVAGIWDLLS